MRKAWAEDFPLWIVALKIASWDIVNAAWLKHGLFVISIFGSRKTMVINAFGDGVTYVSWHLESNPPSRDSQFALVMSLIIKRISKLFVMTVLWTCYYRQLKSKFFILLKAKRLKTDGNFEVSLFIFNG